MLNTVTLVMLLGFMFAADYTMSKHESISLDLEPDPKLTTEVIYYDRIEVGMDGMRTFSPDSIVYVTSRKERKKWD